MDVCERKNYLNELKFKYYNNLTHALESYADLDCSTPITNEDNDIEWELVPTSFRYFKCARLVTSSCETYVVND